MHLLFLKVQDTRDSYEASESVCSVSYSKCNAILLIIKKLNNGNIIAGSKAVLMQRNNIMPCGSPYATNNNCHGKLPSRSAQLHERETFQSIKRATAARFNAVRARANPDKLNGHKTNAHSSAELTINSVTRSADSLMFCVSVQSHAAAKPSYWVFACLLLPLLA